MAVVALSPWPTTPAAVAAANATLAVAMAGRKNSPDQFSAAAARLGPVASALVERYAKDAPQAIKDEAVIMVSAWILERQGGATSTSESVGGPIGISENQRISPGQLGAMRYSGAQSLLGPWKIRRAGKVAS